MTRNVNPYLYGTENSLISQISNLMMGGANPTIQGMQTSAADAINRNYASMPRTVTAQLAGRGFGQSGKLGSALYNIQGNRLGDLSSLSSQFGQMGLNEQNFGSSLAEQLLNSTMGASTSGSQYGLKESAGITF